MANDLNDKTGVIQPSIKLPMQVIRQTLDTTDLKSCCICEEALNIMYTWEEGSQASPCQIYSLEVKYPLEGIRLREFFSIQKTELLGAST